MSGLSEEGGKGQDAEWRAGQVGKRAECQRAVVVGWLSLNTKLAVWLQWGVEQKEGKQRQAGASYFDTTAIASSPWAVPDGKQVSRLTEGRVSHF